MRLREISALLPDVHAILAPGEWRLLEQCEQFVVIKSVAHPSILLQLDEDVQINPIELRDPVQINRLYVAGGISPAGTVRQHWSGGATNP
ncbi:hypothetical protein [Bradyrhizobium sp. NAS80.1]|uniref:hypothetical protein n=1 Tax=Bradyrhizobium sp. NAS80.1 TaxID=1680159 RepID=UPI001AEF72AF|nr:hypothetical protein [Bradyrhizobium sp. NAS80.1]